jgi:hypothetical protein
MLWSRRMWPVTQRMWRTASTMLPEPASPLVRIMRRALADPAQSLAQVPGAADEGHLEGELVDVVRLVGRGEHLALVDEVDLEASRIWASRSGRSGPSP